MILTDTGDLVALLDVDDSYHAECVAAAQRLPAVPLLTAWACFTEANAREFRRVSGLKLESWL